MFSEIEGASLFWVRDGKPEPQTGWSDIAVLMDLGALDRGESLLNGTFRRLIWTEDIETKYLERLIAANGGSSDDTYIFSYQASSKIDAARLMSAFVKRVRPGVRTIIHRDRDFMSDEEVERLKEKYNLSEDGSMSLFVTRGSDVESYFCQAGHLSAALGLDKQDAEAMVEAAISENHNEFAIRFHTKREEIKRDLYRNAAESCVTSSSLIPGGEIPLELAYGKLLFKKLGPKIQLLGKNPSQLLVESDALIDEALAELLVGDGQTSRRAKGA